MAFELIDSFLKEKKYDLLLSREEIRTRVKELGSELSQDYRGKSPILIGVLNGSFMFCGDLFREITIDCEIDFIKISSYRGEKETSGKIKLLKDIDANLKDRDVVLVEDIVDSGYSIQYLDNLIRRQEPASLKFVSLLVKDGAARVPYEIDYVGFNIPNKFIVGYGLDYAQKLRNLPEIYVMD